MNGRESVLFLVRRHVKWGKDNIGLRTSQERCVPGGCAGTSRFLRRWGLLVLLILGRQTELSLLLVREWFPSLRLPLCPLESDGEAVEDGVGLGAQPAPPRVPPLGLAVELLEEGLSTQGLIQSPAFSLRLKSESRLLKGIASPRLK